MSTKIKHHFFPNLIAIRFYLATYGVIGHTNDMLSIMGIKTFQRNHVLFLSTIGSLCLTAFFVISGFLITHILIEEKDQTNTIDLKRFFINRIFRIWPAFYLVLIFQWFILSQTPVNEFSNMFYAHTYSISNPNPIMMNHYVYFLLSFMMLPQLSLTLSIVFDNWTTIAGHLWSTGTEELFYFIWAPLFKKTTDIIKSIRNSILIYYTLSIFIFLCLAISIVVIKSKKVSLVFHAIVLFLYLSRLDCIFIGAIGAYIFYYRKEIVVKFVTKKNAYIAGILTFLLLISKFPIPLVTHELFSALLTFLIVYFVKDNKPVAILDNKIINYLGKISYGIYLYHVSIIFIVVYFCKKYNFYVVPVIYIIILTFSIIVASISYEYYEKQLQKLKIKYFIK